MRAGPVVPPCYESLLGKMLVWDEDRAAAIARALRALGEFTVEGVTTTIAAAGEILRSEEFTSGRYSTSYLADAEGRLAALAPS